MGRLRKKQSLDQGNTWSDRPAITISKLIFKLQKSFATVLSNTAAKFPNSTIRWVVVLFTLGWVIVSTWYISLSFTGIKKQSTIYISHFRRPLTNNNINEKRPAIIAITEDEYNEMVQFHRYMDSLGKYANQVYDSILSARPGLMDSVLLLEKIYNQQKK